MSYDMTLDLLNDVLPIGDDIGKGAVHANLARIVQRLDAEIGDEYKSVIQETAAPAEPAPDAPAPLAVGIDGGYVHACNGTRRNGWFEVIVGKSVPHDGESKVFGFVQRTEEKPKRRLRNILDSQGIQANHPIVFLSDGGDSVRNLQKNMSPHSEHILDWFHVTMRMTVMKNLAVGLQKSAELSDDEQRGKCSTLTDDVASIKWNIWHGKVDCALEKISALAASVAAISMASPNAPKLLEKLEKLAGYISANRAFIPNYGERRRARKIISTAFAESTVNQVISWRFVKKKQMRWSERGSHNVLQIRTRVINDELRPVMQGWYPGLRIAA